MITITTTTHERAHEPRPQSGLGVSARARRRADLVARDRRVAGRQVLRARRGWTRSWASSAPCSSRAGRSGCSKATSAVLLDRSAAPEVCAAVREGIERVDGNRVVDLHVWCIGLNLYSAVADRRDAVAAARRSTTRRCCRAGLNIVHATVEVHARRGIQISTVQEQILVYDFRVKPRPPAPRRALASAPGCSAAASARGRRCSPSARGSSRSAASRPSASRS